jgi:hypothetical protein
MTSAEVTSSRTVTRHRLSRAGHCLAPRNEQENILATKVCQATKSASIRAKRRNDEEKKLRFEAAVEETP